MRQLLHRAWERFWRKRTDADLEEELRVHFALYAEDHAARGIPVTEARRKARLGLGSRRAIIERVRDQDLATFLESLYRDFKLGLRALRKAPIFSITAILTLAAGIGANTAIFTLLYSLLLRSLPVPYPQQLVSMSLKLPENAQTYEDVWAPHKTPYRMFERLERQQHSFIGLSAWRPFSVSMTDKDGSPRILEAA